ncbi:hypothetical protein DC487_00590 [Sphingobacterium corticibacter]|uniref:Uncharacterized protein n=1 Tax=Sphingobacterium corticibacter TaxID=2171749 RepID=A0A2T8HL33_9SPHI|nr:hypothetical protein DC487_00590 [Sphingobacterium corticibacter]
MVISTTMANKSGKLANKDLLARNETMLAHTNNIAPSFIDWVAWVNSRTVRRLSNKNIRSIILF